VPPTASPSRTAADLGSQVTAYLLDGEREPHGWSAFRNVLDGTVAIVVETVPIGGRQVQIQMLGNLAAALQRGGFELTVETVWPEQTEPVDGGVLFIHVTARTTT
jgi:hypothetical protein